jgi:hypothetical protein
MKNIFNNFTVSNSFSSIAKAGFEECSNPKQLNLILENYLSISLEPGFPTGGPRRLLGK